MFLQCIIIGNDKYFHGGSGGLVQRFFLHFVE